MIHIISSPTFTEYSQERLGSKVPRRIEEPEDTLSRWATQPETKPVSRNVFQGLSFDGLRRHFGVAPKVRNS